MPYFCQTVCEYSQRLANGSILRETVDSFKMAKQEWSRVDIEEMIVEYEGRPSLWDVCSPEYRDRNKKTEAWKTKPTQPVKSGFFQEMKKKVGEQKSGQGAVDVYKSKWPCIDSLKCIKGPPAAIKTTGKSDV